MSRFVFRLEKVRRLRQSAEDRAREELAASLVAQRDSEAAVGAAEHRIEGALGTHRRIAALAGASAADLVAAQAYLERLETERRMAERTREHHDFVAQQRRDALQAAAQEREALDRLRDKRLSAHRIETERAAAVTLDELALRMHANGAAA